MQESLLVRLGGSSWCIFPWLGTRAFRTLKRYLKLHSGEYGLSDIQSEGCYYITFKCRMENPYQLLKEIVSQIKKEGIDAKELVFAGECPIQDKYDDVVPPELLRLAYSEDRLEVEEVLTRLLGEVS